MSNESPLASLDRFLAQHTHVIEVLCEEAGCAKWKLPPAVFADGLRRSAVKNFGGSQTDAAAVEVYLKSLHLEDLALACACIEGIESAWEFFVAHFRHDLRQTASAMLRRSGRADDARARELADALYADLYGVRSGADGRRKSLFEYFHGRSKLSTWLRAVLSQKQVDMIRTAGRTVSLEVEIEEDASRARMRRADSVVADPDPDREMYLGRFDRALTAALAGLLPRERMILACYYVDQQSLAEIGSLLQEHESTVSRQLERVRRALRESVTGALRSEIPASGGRRAEPALDAAQIELVFEYALGEWPFDLSKALSAPETPADPSEE